MEKKGINSLFVKTLDRRKRERERERERERGRCHSYTNKLDKSL